MSPEQYLPTLAEVGITIAGFTGLIVTIRRGNSRPFTKQELLRVIGTISICLITVLCSALPFALSGFSIAPHLKWAIPLLISSSVTLFLIGRIVGLMLTGEFIFIARWITWPLLAIVAVFSIAAFCSGIGLFLPYSPGLLVLYLTVALFSSAVTLVATLAIVIRSEQESKSAVTRSSTRP